MALTEWTPDMETGDPLVDLQHKQLFALIAQLDDAPDNAAEIMRTLDCLSEYVLMHFGTEEALMERTGFSKRLYAAHVQEHRAFTERFRQKIIEFRLGQLRSVTQLQDFLHQWLEEHVNRQDRVLVQYVRRMQGDAMLQETWSPSSDPMPQ